MHPCKDYMLSRMILRTCDLNLMIAHITRRAFSKCLQANLNSRAVKYMQAQVSRYEHTGYVLAGSSRHAYHPKKICFLGRYRYVTLPLSFCHVLKHPKVIESDSPWRALLVAYLFCALEIQLTRCNGQWKTRDSS